MPTRPSRHLSLCIASLLLFACPSAHAAPGANGSRLDPGEVKDLLRVHNRARADVGVRPLQWSPQVAKSAQRWADRLADSSCRMEHSRGSGYGENLYRATAGYYEVEDAALAWAHACTAAARCSGTTGRPAATTRRWSGATAVTSAAASASATTR